MNTTTNRGDLTDAQWAGLLPYLPPQKPPTRRTAHDHRPIINGMLWIDRTGAPWRDLPPCYGPVGTVSSRFYRWRQAGIWDRILAALQQLADEAGDLDWELHYVDGTVIRAHQHAAGAHDSTPEAEALGRSRGGFGTKLHLRAEGRGRPLVILLTPGQQNEVTMFEPLMEAGTVRRRRGRPKQRPKRVAADKGYRSRAVAAYLRRRGIRQTIPAKRNQWRRGAFDRAAYRERNRVERLINRVYAQ